jgi:hypothetical protein
VIRRVLTLLAASAAFAVAVGVPARYLVGDQALLYCLTALLITTVPALLTLVVIELLFVAKPEIQGLAMLGSGGVRIVLALLAAAVLYLTQEAFRSPSFLFWVGASYIYLLIIEVWLVLQTLAGNRSRAGSEG